MKCDWRADMGERILYISDLDGTLLNSNKRLSKYTSSTINLLVEKGMMFSYATARSFSTASKVAKELNANFPVIVYNGAFILNNITESVMLSNFFDNSDILSIKQILIEHNIYPMVYAYCEESEKYSYDLNNINHHGMRMLIDGRSGDKRENPVNSIEELFAGKIFYFTCIDEQKLLYPVYERLKDKYTCIFQRDIYNGEQWLEILPKNTSKANAVLQLKDYLKCDKIISFGDGKNDISMFEISDECYAVKNAVDELKEIATGIIDSNNNDGVAKWLVQNTILKA